MPKNSVSVHVLNETARSTGHSLIPYHRPITETERVHFLFKLAGLFHAQGLASDAIYQRLLIQNHCFCHPPLPTDQIRAIVVIAIPTTMSVNGFSAPVVNALVPVNTASPLENHDEFSAATQALTVTRNSNVIPLVQEQSLCLLEPEVIIVSLNSSANDDAAGPLRLSHATTEDSQTANHPENGKASSDDYYYQKKSKTYRKPETLVANFVARFTEIIHSVKDNKKSTHYVLEGRFHNGCDLPRLEISGDDLNKPGWQAKWHPLACVYSGQQGHIFGSIQQFSESRPFTTRTIYKRLGWYEEQGRFVYFHGTGAIASNGVVPHVEVEPLNEEFAPYALPAPPPWEQLPVILTQVVQLTQVVKNAGYLLLALVARAVLNEVYFADFMVYIIGTSGKFKTSLILLLLMFFGDFKRKAPANWSDTPSALERKCHDAKDTLLLIDEHTAHTAEGRKDLLTKSARITMNIGNAASRSRVKSNLELQDSYSPRGFSTCTGEEMPCGLSAIARTLIVRTEHHRVNVNALTAAQTVASRGIYRLFMAAYVQWLAPQIKPLKDCFPQQVESWRAKLQGSHPRHAEKLGNLMAGLEVMQRFFNDVSHHTGQPVQLDLNEAERQLRLIVDHQEVLLSEQDDCERFLSLLVKVFAEGTAHLELKIEQDPRPAYLVKFGWECDDKSKLIPEGPSIGYVDADQIYLNGVAAYGAVRRQAAREGCALDVPKETLLTRMREKGLIHSTQDGKKTRNSHRRMIRGKYDRWICIDIATLYPD